MWVIACDPTAGPDNSTERTVEEGVEQVVNRGPDIPLPWSLHENVRIPPDLDGEVRFAQVTASDVAADGEGRIYILDTSGGRVLVFGRTGRVVGTVGRSGQGPGELGEPVALGVSAQGELAVYDYAAGGVRRWSVSGARSLQRLEAPFWGPGLAVAPWGLVYPAMGVEESDRRVVRLAVEGETRTGFLTEVAQPLVSVSFPSCGIAGPSMTPIFTPELRWSLADDVVVAAAGPEYRIDVFDGGVLVRTVARDVPPVPGSGDLARKAAGDGLQLTVPTPCRVPPEEVAATRGFAPVIPAISGLAVAPDGSIWVRRSEVPGRGEPPIDILGPDGGYLGTLPPGSPFPIAFAGRGRDYRTVSIRVSELGEADVVVYGVVRLPVTVEGGSAGRSQ